MKVERAILSVIFLTAVCLGESLAAVINLHEEITAAGMTPVISSSESNASYPASKAFDGDWTTDSGRWLGTRIPPNAYIEYRMPEGWRPDQLFSLSKYRIYRMNVGSFQYIERMPVDFCVYGSAGEDGEWVLLDSRTDVDWSFSEYIDFDVEFVPSGFRAFKLEISRTKSSDSAWRTRRSSSSSRPRWTC